MQVLRVNLLSVKPQHADTPLHFQRIVVQLLENALVDEDTSREGRGVFGEILGQVREGAEWVGGFGDDLDGFCSET